MSLTQRFYEIANRPIVVPERPQAYTSICKHCGCTLPGTPLDDNYFGKRLCEACRPPWADKIAFGLRPRPS